MSADEEPVDLGHITEGLEDLVMPPSRYPPDSQVELWRSPSHLARMVEHGVEYTYLINGFAEGNTRIVKQWTTPAVYIVAPDGTRGTDCTRFRSEDKRGPCVRSDGEYLGTYPRESLRCIPVTEFMS